MTWAVRDVLPVFSATCKYLVYSCKAREDVSLSQSVSGSCISKSTLAFNFTSTVPPALLTLGCRQQQNNANYDASLSMRSDGLTLEQGQSVIGLNQQHAQMSMNNAATVACLPNGKIRLEGTTIDIGKVQISDNKIVGTENGVPFQPRFRSFALRAEAPMNAANNGCALQGRDLNSG